MPRHDGDYTGVPVPSPGVTVAGKDVGPRRISVDIGGRPINGDRIAELEAETARLRARLAVLEPYYREMYAELEREYGRGVANGCWPDLAPKMARWRAALGEKPNG